MRAAVAGDGDPVEKLKAPRDGPLAGPGRTLMGSAQEKWLYDGFAQSRKRGAKWQILAQQALVGQWNTPSLPPEFSQNLRLPPEGAAYLKAIDAATKAGLPPDLDSWSGFPAARSRLLGAAQAADADLVVLSGDSHNAWAFDLAEGGKPAGVELAAIASLRRGWRVSGGLPGDDGGAHQKRQSRAEMGRHQQPRLYGDRGDARESHGRVGVSRQRGHAHPRHQAQP